MGRTIQLCTFNVEHLAFGVEVTMVQEVLRTQPMTRVPLAREVVRGLINLRGQIVTAIDLRALLGFPPRPEIEWVNVVLRGHDGWTSLLVDQIGDVIEVPSSALEAPPSTLKPTQRKLIEAVCKLPGQLLLVLSPQRALGFTHVEAARGTRVQA